MHTKHLAVRRSAALLLAAAAVLATLTTVPAAPAAADAPDLRSGFGITVQRTQPLAGSSRTWSNHSIPDALAVAIRTPAGLVLHTGDFKMDQLPLDGRITDLRAFARLGEEGVDLFLTDSTNTEVPGFTTPEVRHQPGPRPGVPHQPAADHRGLLRQPRPSRAAGARCRGGPRPQGRVRRPLHGPQHGHRTRAGLPERAGRRPGRRQGPRRARPPSGRC